MDIRKTSIAVLATWFAMTAQAQIQTGIDAMLQAFQTFVASDDVKKKDTHWSHSQDQWTFKYVCDGDTMPMPASLATLTDAFNDNARYATSFYSHSTKDGIAPFAHLTFKRKDNFFNGISGHFTINKNENFCIMNLSDSAGQTSYVMTWNMKKHHDRNGQPFCTIDGCISRFYDNIWKMGIFHQDDPWKSGEQATRPINKEDQSRYETLTAQLKYLADNYSTQKASGNEKGCDAIAYMVRKVCNGFEGKITQQQYDEIKSLLNVFYADTTMKERAKTVGYAMAQIRQNIAVGILKDKLRHASFNTGPFTHPDNVKLLDMFYDFGNEGLPLVNVKLSGTIDKDCKQVKIQSKYPDHKPYAATTQARTFEFSTPLTLNQIYQVYDEDGHSIMIFADSIPTNIDLRQMTVSGSKLNERFAEYQRRLNLLKQERYKYLALDSDEDFYPTVIDEEGYERLLADAHALQMQFISENADNLIPAWCIAENFTQMSADELKRSLRKGSAYADHFALQPARQYYDGLLKRQPGMKFKDVACTDSTGNRHMLSEYIGKGEYVLLHFWSYSNSITRSGCKLMKQLHKKYADKGLRVIGITYGGDGWKKYAKSRDLSFMHLCSADEAVKRDFDYEPQILSTYGINALPESILFDPKGRIVASGLAGDALKKKVKSLLNQ